MKIQQLASSFGPGVPQQFAMSFVVDDVLAIDAGCVGFAPLEAQRRIRHVVLSHSHIDHVGSLPQFVENVYEAGPACPTVYGSAATLDCLRRDVFNDRLWPDMVRLSTEEQTTFLKLETLTSGVTVRAAHLSVTPVEVEHIVPTLGFIVEDAETAVAFVSDTGPTEAIWAAANRCDKLKAVFLEASFPNAMEWLAVKSAHLTPRMFLNEYRKLRWDVPVVVIHIKAAFRDELLDELAALGLPQLQIASPEQVYEF